MSAVPVNSLQTQLDNFVRAPANGLIAEAPPKLVMLQVEPKTFSHPKWRTGIVAQEGNRATTSTS